MSDEEDTLPGLKITEAEIELEEEQMTYELEGSIDGKTYEIEVTPDGKIIEIEEEKDDS